jgi:hypothetical protein
VRNYRVLWSLPAFGASDSWQTPHSSCAPHDGFSMRPRHTNASASMIPLQMAKTRILSHAIATLSDTSYGLRSLLQRSTTRQTFCPVYSRASCSWIRNDVAQTGRLAVASRSYKQCRIPSISLFSTSTTRRLKLEDEANSSKTSRNDVEVGRASSYQNYYVHYVVSLNLQSVSLGYVLQVPRCVIPVAIFL